MKQFSVLKLLVVTAALFLGACASVNSVSITPIPAEKTNVVTASVEKTIVLGFNFNNDFVDPLVQDLKRKCQGGVVSGILTKDEVIHYFLFHTRKVTATGFCSRTLAAQKRNSRGAASDLEAPATATIVD